MKNKIIKTLLILAIVIMIFNCIPLHIQAFSDPSQNPNDWKPTITNNNTTEFKPMIKSILGYVNLIGVVVSVIVLIVIGIKYMMGSAEEKAEYKKTTMGYVIGALMVFSITTVANILYNIGTSI